MPVHRHARAFGDVAERYERGRPGFPAGGISFLARALDLRPGRRLCDVAAGTGKLTRQLRDTGARIVAVEPVPGMRRTFARMVPGIEVRDGTAEQLPLADGSVDAVTVAQAFHWFDPVAAFAEMDRVLSPGGRVALVWNIRDESDPVEAAASRVLEAHRDGAPSHRTLDLAGAVSVSPFAQVDEYTQPWTHEVTVEVFLDRFLSVSFVAAMDEDTRREVVDELQALFERSARHGRARHAYTFRAHVLARRTP